MSFNPNLAIVAWLENGNARMRVGCPDHMTVGEEGIAYEMSGTKVILLCPKGCPLGEWNNEEEYFKDLRALEARAFP